MLRRVKPRLYFYVAFNIVTILARMLRVQHERTEQNCFADSSR
jgi:ACR3 family arsenite efflux pump ArsB